MPSHILEGNDGQYLRSNMKCNRGGAMTEWVEIPVTDKARRERLKELWARLRALEQESRRIYTEIDAIQRALAGAYTMEGST